MLDAGGRAELNSSFWGSVTVSYQVFTSGIFHAISQKFAHISSQWPQWWPCLLLSESIKRHEGRVVIGSDARSKGLDGKRFCGWLKFCMHIFRDELWKKCWRGTRGFVVLSPRQRRLVHIPVLETLGQQEGNQYPSHGNVAQLCGFSQQGPGGTSLTEVCAC